MGSLGAVWVQFSAINLFLGYKKETFYSEKQTNKQKKEASTDRWILRSDLNWHIKALSLCQIKQLGKRP